MGSPNESPANESPLTGRCACSHVRYTLSSPPLIVHACHCTYCQRETGTSFALNALYEPDRVHTTLSTGENGEEAETQLLRKGIPTATSGAEGQVMVRCPECFTVLWSHYSGTTRSLLKIVRVGTIDGLVDGERYVPSGGLRPHAHIFAGSGSKRHRWFDIPEGDVVFDEYGPMEEYWPKESLERYKAFSDRVGFKEQGK
ncbi:glutathione-dependent formaldehyde- gfa [Colletotrichum camelliae]|nr:glutathione-dependent formaldehyde- gfa [Colletotrichum camelliae]